MNETSFASEMNISNHLSGSDDMLSTSSQNMSNYAERQIPKKYNIQGVQLSKKSRQLLILRVILIFLIFIFFPMEILLYTRLEATEKNHLTTIVTNKYSRSLNSFKWLVYIFENICLNKDVIMIYISLIYTFSHPFIGLKLVLVINSLDYGITLLQCILQAKRPFWFDQRADYPLCEVNFAKPSGQFFLSSFFLMYIPICFNLIKKKKQRLSQKYRIVYFILYLAIIAIHGLILVIYRLYFLYQLIYTLTITFACIAFLSDFDIFVHNIVLSSMKTIFKTRQYKMRFLFRILLLTLLALFVNYSINPHNLNSLENNISNITKCNPVDLKEFGLLRTFFEVPYLYGILGAFWGASLTVETECNKWWEQNNIFKIICKLILVVICSACILTAFYFMTLHVDYEFDFTLQCIKYMLFYYVIMGLLPLLYDKLKLNEVSDNNVKQPKNVPLDIFTSSILIGGDVFENVSFVKEGNIKKEQGKYEIIKEEENEDDEETKEKVKQSTLKSKGKIHRVSHITKGMEQHNKNEGGINYKMEFHSDEEEI